MAEKFPLPAKLSGMHTLQSVEQITPPRLELLRSRLKLKPSRKLVGRKTNA